MNYASGFEDSVKAIGVVSGATGLILGGSAVALKKHKAKKPKGKKKKRY